MYAHVIPEVNGRKLWRSTLKPLPKESAENKRKKQKKHKQVERCAEGCISPLTAVFTRWIGPPTTKWRSRGGKEPEGIPRPGNHREKVRLCPGCAKEWEDYLGA
jgi:hypothetical protein